MVVFIFDLDDVLVHEGFDPPILCRGTIDVLNDVRNKGKLAIASHNDNGTEIMKTLGILHLFDYIQSYNDNNKLKHLCSIVKHFNVNYEDCILFDDLIDNIFLANKLGMKSVLVNHISGITIFDLKNLKK